MTASTRTPALGLAVLFVVFLAAHQVGLRVSTPFSPLSPVWPPAGVALGAYLLLPRRSWPWALGVLVAAVAASNALSGVRMWVGFAYLGASLVELAAALWIVGRIAGPAINFHRARDTFALLLAASVGSGAGGVIAAWIAAVASGAPVPLSFGIWWAAHLLGMVLLTPLVVAWTRAPIPLAKVPVARLVEGGAFLVFWSWAAFHVFRGDLTLGWIRPHPYMLASLLTWAAFRLGIRGVTAAMTTVAVVAFGVVLEGSEHFPLGDGSLAAHLLMVQVFLVIVGVTGLLLASALAEGQSASDHAQDTTDHLRRANRALRTIWSCHDVLVRATSERELLQEVCRVIVEQGGFTLAWVGNPEHDEEQHVRPVAYSGYQEGYLESLDIRWGDSELGRGPTGTAIRTKRPVIVHDILTDPTMGPWRADAMKHGYRAFACLPLVYDDAVLGTLSVYAPDGDAFDDEEMRLLGELAEELAFGLTTIRVRAQRALAERALAASEERFRQLAENIREIFWMLDARTGQTIYLSPSVERILGVSAEALLANQQLSQSLVHPDDRERVAEGLARVAAGGEFDEQYRNLLPDGTVRWLHARAFPVRDDSGAVARVVGVSDDITERRRIEEQLRQVQKLEAIGQLAGGIAHDFNNILGAILIQTGMAQSLPGLSAEAREIMADVESSAQRAANLTRQLLLFSRKQVMQPREVELNDLVATLARMLRRVVPEDVQLQLKMHPRSLPVVGDPGMLEQVVMNLTVNARDAMPTGGLLVIETYARDLTADEVRAFPGVAPGRFHGVSVRDTGTGIAPEARPHIFDPFFTTKAVGKGTGLGLATAFGIVQQHRGVIFVHSTVGVGSTFEILIPAAASARAAPDVSAPLPAASPRGEATILLVEDDDSLRNVLRRVLEEQGYRVHTARSGVEALRAWPSYVPTPDLLFTDMVMPDGVGGCELAKQLQERHPALRVIYSSGYDPDVGSHRTLLEPGVNFLQKPATPRAIAEIVARMLARKSDVVTD
ncbi:MAG: GAF domain-containing protein [Gemmatimonadaceae bacterium]|nr:GAF domain-containing protein [Gemmatimonadaceae bacterium]